MNMVHTTIRTQGQTTYMTYHQTDVVAMAIGKDKVTITLNNGGHYTKTTKKRMNQFAEMFGLGYRVYQTDGVWWVDFSDRSLVGFEPDGTLTFSLEN